VIFLQIGLLSIVVALVRRGKIQHLADMKIERFWLVFVPAALTAVGIILYQRTSVTVWGPATVIINVLVNTAFLAFFWANRRLPGVNWFIGGWALNFMVIAANHSKMPVSQWASSVAGCGRVGENMGQHALLTSSTKLSFLADIIPVPGLHPIMSQVASAGDILMAVGLFLLIQLTMCPRKAVSEAQAEGDADCG
jgi:hypothetical protein